MKRTPNDDPRLRGADGARTLVDDLGELADDMRQIGVDLGLRPYRVFSVRLRWSGDRVGLGEPAVVLEEEFLPTPKVSTSLRREAREPGGWVERGRTTLTEVSPRYTEAQIDALCPRTGPANEERFIEIRMDSRDENAPRRRFVVAEAPERRAERFDWRVVLVPQDDARTRAGAPVVAPRTPYDRGGPR